MVRSFLPPDRWKETEVTLSGEEARHLARALRARPGDRVTLFDGEGREAEAIVSGVGAREVLLRLGPIRLKAPSPWEITLALAVPGNVKMDEIVNQAIQLGAGRIVPLVTERTVTRFTPERWRSRQERLNRIAVETAKQCGVGRLPSIESLARWKELLESFPSYDLILMASVEGPHEPLASVLVEKPARNILLLIGPEGDFTCEEIEAAAAQGARRFSLGPTILRCETAVIASLSILNFLLGSDPAGS